MADEAFISSVIPTLRFTRGGVLLTGPEGLGQKKDVLALAAKFLGGDPLKHPDFIDFSIIEDEDRVLALRTSLSMVPAKAERRVVYIPNIDLLGPVMENRLLKVIEEEDAFFICTAQGDTLGTVSSRLMVIPYTQRPLAVFLEEGGKIPEWFCSGDEEVSPVFDTVYDAIVRGDTKKVLEVLNLVKEKDKEAFCEKHGVFIPSLFCLIGKALSDRKESPSVVAAAIGKANAVRDRYSLPEFFADVAELVSF